MAATALVPLYAPSLAGASEGEARPASYSLEGARSSLSGRLSYQTARASGSDFRAFRIANYYEGEGAMAQPNTNSLRASLHYVPFRAHALSAGASLSLDKPDSGASRRGWDESYGRRGSRSPSLSLRYSYRLAPSYSLGLAGSYRAERLGDPSLGATYRAQAESWGQSLGLSLTAPTSERSRRLRLITKATARGTQSFSLGSWEARAGLSHSQSFHESGAPLSAYSSRSHSSGSGRSGRRGGSRGGEGSQPGLTSSSEGAQPPPESHPVFDEADIALAERETGRSSCSLGLSFSPSRRWKLSSGTGLTYIQTARQRTVWLSSARVLGASFRIWDMEAGSGLQLLSDVRDHRHPTLPKILGVDFQLSYIFGDGRSSPL